MRKVVERICREFDVPAYWTGSRFQHAVRCGYLIRKLAMLSALNPDKWREQLAEKKDFDDYIYGAQPVNTHGHSFYVELDGEEHVILQIEHGQLARDMSGLRLPTITLDMAISKMNLYPMRDFHTWNFVNKTYRGVFKHFGIPLTLLDYSDSVFLKLVKSKQLLEGLNAIKESRDHYVVQGLKQQPTAHLAFLLEWAGFELPIVAVNSNQFEIQPYCAGDDANHWVLYSNGKYPLCILRHCGEINGYGIPVVDACNLVAEPLVFSGQLRYKRIHIRNFVEMYTQFTDVQLPEVTDGDMIHTAAILESKKLVMAAYVYANREADMTWRDIAVAIAEGVK